MDLFEFESKKLLSSFGIPIPEGRLIYNANEPAPLEYPFVLKGQALIGGRGKAGAVKICCNAEEYSYNLQRILGMSIKGVPVEAALAEGKANIQKEYYVSITMRGTNASPILIISAMGGMDIEEASRINPNSVLTVNIDPLFGIKYYQLRQIFKKLCVENANELSSIIYSLYKVFKCLNATLVEINPLALTDKGLVALDAKISLDDKAEYKLKELYSEIAEGRKHLVRFSPPTKEETTITFVDLHGEVGLISDGAGTGMMTLDLIHDAGGHVASFCELGGITNAEVMYKAMRLTLEKDIKSIVVVLIGGFNRMDDMAKGIISYKKEFGLKVPVFTRMCGTMEAEGKQLMTKEGLILCDDLMDAVNKAVAAAGV